MKIFSWNVRGINSSARQGSVNSWLRKNHPLVGSILETRTKEANAVSIIQSTFPGWRWETNYSHSDLGRIWVVWDPVVSVIIYKTSAQYILCGIYDLSTQVSITSAFVYGFNTEAERQELWRDISTLNQLSLLSSSPWVLLSDFNQILTMDEHYSVLPSDAPLRGMSDL